MALSAIWNFRGSVPLDPAFGDEAVLDRLDAMLGRQWKRVAERGTDFIAFTHPIWNMGPNWVAMVMYDQGVFWITREPEGRCLRYRLRSLHGFIFCLFAALMFFIFGLVGGGLNRGLMLGSLAFGWLYGMNLFLAAMRVPDLIERTVSAA